MGLLPFETRPQPAMSGLRRGQSLKVLALSPANCCDPPLHPHTPCCVHSTQSSAVSFFSPSTNMIRDTHQLGYLPQPGCTNKGASGVVGAPQKLIGHKVRWRKLGCGVCRDTWKLEEVEVYTTIGLKPLTTHVQEERPRGCKIHTQKSKCGNRS